MKIALILHPIAEDNPAGLGRFVYEMSKGLLATRREDTFVLISKKKLDLKKLYPTLTSHIEEIVLGDSAVWSTRVVWRRRDIDLVIALTPIAPLFLPRGAKLITCAHDFAFVDFDSAQSRIGLWILYALSFFRSARICVVSKFTGNELHRLFYVPRKKIAVVYSGYDHISVRPLTVHSPQNYFLVVGIIKERKNTLRIIQAFELFVQQHTEYMLRIVGKYDGEYGVRVRTYVDRHGLSEKILFEGFVSNEILDERYMHTAAVVYPSLIEGFGLPILEAMAQGAPLITSSVGATAEIAGDAAVLVDPLSEQAIKEGMERVVAEGAYQEYKKRGRARIAHFPWGESVRLVSEAIETVCKK